MAGVDWEDILRQKSGLYEALGNVAYLDSWKSRRRAFQA